MESTETTQDRVSRLRSLNEGEKLSLICTQQRKIAEYEKRIEAFHCAHSTNRCAMCQDKDLMIAQLNSQIEQLKKKIYGRSSERRDRAPKDPRDKKKPKKRSTRKRLPSEQFPDAEVVPELISAKSPPICSECEHEMVDSGLREISERLKIQPAEIYIKEMRRVRYHCKCCQSALITAPLPPRLAPKSSLGDDFLIQASISKYYDLIPTSRLAKIFGRGTANVSHNLLLRAQSLMAAILRPVYETLKKNISNSRVVFADETVHRQLEQNGGRWRWYLWAFCNANSVYFEIHDTRAGDVSIDVLKTSPALFLVSDAYSGYSRTLREINAIRTPKGLPLLQACLCNDHSRRYFYYAQKEPLAEKVLDAYGKIYGIERKVQELIASPQYNEPEDSVKALALRQTADPYFEKIYNISTDIMMNSPPRSPEVTAANYFLTHLVGLKLYLSHLELPISNVRTEGRIRDHVVLRKTALGNHSLQGAKEASIHLSVMGSCKMVGIKPTEYSDFIKRSFFAKERLLTPYEYKLHKAKAPDTS
jgi:transposase